MIDDVRSATTFVTRRSNWPRTALLGALLSAGWGTLVPPVLLAGYAARVLRAGRTDGLPGFDGLGDLAADGCRLAAVVAGYNLLPAALVLVGVRRSELPVGFLLGDLAFAARNPDSARGALRSLVPGGVAPDPVAVALLAVGALLAVPAGYLGTVAATRVARTRRVADGFDTAVLSTARRPATVAAWLPGICVLLVGRLLGGVLGAVPVVGWLVAAAVAFHASVAATRLWALRLDRPAPAWRSQDGGSASTAGAD